MGRKENKRNLQIQTQQLDGDVKVCKPWEQERFRGPDDVAKMLGVVVSVVVATLLDERIPQTRPHKPAAKRQRRLCCLILLQTNPCAASCKLTGRSTSGGIVTVGSHVLKTDSRQQKTVALSSAEAELHAMVAASAEALGIVALMKDMGVDAIGEVYADSSAALGIAQRQGMGKVRHIRTQALWVQEVRATGRLSYKKVLGTRNPSDILTKHVASTLLEQHLLTVGAEFRGGRADSAPTLDEIQPYDESAASRVVRFSPVVSVKMIPAVGKGRPTKTMMKLRWPLSEKGSAEAQSEKDASVR